LGDKKTKGIGITPNTVWGKKKNRFMDELKKRNAVKESWSEEETCIKVPR